MENGGNDTMLDHPDKRDSLYIVVPITVLYSVIFVTGFVGNIITCIVISRNKHMHTATNYYLFSLAVSDLLLLVTGLPPEMYSIWYKYPYVFGEVFCVLRGLAAETSANATVLTITAFTVERYLAICHPFLAHTMSKLSRAIKIIFSIWIVALSFAVPQAAQFGVVEIPDQEHTACLVKRMVFHYSFEVSTFLFFLLPMTLITVLYVLIGLRLRRTTLGKTTEPLGSQQDPGKGSRQQSSKRVLRMLVAVVVAFFICWAPFHAQRLVTIYVVPQFPHSLFTINLYTVITYLSGILYYVSTTVNPILYQIMSLKFREAFKMLLGWRSTKDTTRHRWRRPDGRRWAVLRGGSGKGRDRQEVDVTDMTFMKTDSLRVAEG
uniref:G-protein coupled receptors family 1 profile domain-containing protein n=1 Tax=Clastoptera arizonana TaxID=38151 RepID=A0A1B6CAS5_9HEMI